MYNPPCRDRSPSRNVSNMKTFHSSMQLHMYAGVAHVTRYLVHSTWISGQLFSNTEQVKRTHRSRYPTTTLPISPARSWMLFSFSTRTIQRPNFTLYTTALQWYLSVMQFPPSVLITWPPIADGLPCSTWTHRTR